MRYYYANNIISMTLFGYNIEVARVGGREWRLAIVECTGAVLNKFAKVGEYENADYGEVPGTTMFWNFDRAPTLGTIIKTIKEYKANRDEHLAFMQSIGAKA